MNIGISIGIGKGGARRRGYSTAELAALIAAAGGSWWRTSDATSLQQQIYGGATAATAQTVGSIADTAPTGGESVSDYLAAKPELITKPGPFADTAGWAGVTGTSLSAVGGEILVDYTTSTSLARTTIPFPAEVGKRYVATVVVRRVSGGGTTTALVGRNGALTGGSDGGGQQGVTTNGVAETITFWFTASQTTQYLGVSNSNLTAVVAIISASVKETSGRFAASAATDKRPVLSANSLLAFDKDDALSANIATSLGDTCTTITVDRSSVAIRQGQTVGAGAYALPKAGWTDHILLPVSLEGAGISASRLEAMFAVDPALTGSGALANVRATLAAVKAGSGQCSLAFIGDSWVNGGYWTLQFAQRLQTEYGFAGLGWVGLQYFGTETGTWVDGGTQPSGGGAGCARTDLSPNPIFSGTWTSTNAVGAPASPSLGDVSSSQAGAYVRFAFPAGHNAADLYYSGDGTGVVQYSWDGGATWSANLSLTGVGPSYVALASVPTGAASLRIKVTSGNVSLTGVNMKSTATGVVVHKLGASGSSSTHWTAVNLATLSTQIASLDPDLVGAVLGTNDQSAALPAATFGTNAAAIMGAMTGVDRLWICPAENARTTNAIAMPQYSAAAKAAASAGGYACLDLSAVWGDDPNTYKDGTTLGLLRADNIHPVNETGGALISNAVWRALAPGY